MQAAGRSRKGALSSVSFFQLPHASPYAEDSGSRLDGAVGGAAESLLAQIRLELHEVARTLFPCPIPLPEHSAVFPEFEAIPLAGVRKSTPAPEPPLLAPSLWLHHDPGSRGTLVQTEEAPR